MGSALRELTVGSSFVQENAVSVVESDYDKAERYLQKAQLAADRGRYDDMADFMTELVKMGNALNVAERHLLRVAFRQMITAQRASRRIEEVKQSCHRIISLIDNYLLDSVLGTKYFDSEAS